MLFEKVVALINRSASYFKFLAVGLPVFLFGISLNIFLVNFCSLSIPISYIFIQIIQVVVNFFMCKKFVFTNTNTKLNFLVFTGFLISMLAFRLVDWAFYVIEVKFFRIYFLIAQIANVFIFSIFKYWVSEKLFSLHSSMNYQFLVRPSQKNP